ncbi:MAG: putative sulfate exporter family transporter [Anaerolineae bacterium]|nr:putative sulfate exporter family transporter [Anaerolineae bacterium]
MRWLGARLALSPRMSGLVAVGTSICGATAIVATGPAIDAKEEEITYAVANITLFGILAMFLYPFLAHALFANDPTSAGLFLGTSIHETAQVAGSGLIYAEQYDDDEALDVATVTKLVRNVLMAAVIPLMSYLYRQQTLGSGEQRKINLLSLFPMFILGFLLFAVFRTVGDATLDGGSAWGIWGQSAWDDLTATVKLVAEDLLAVAMAGVGLGTSLAQLRGLGLKPFYVGFGAAVVVGALSLSGIAVLNLLNLT